MVIHHEPTRYDPQKSARTGGAAVESGVEPNMMGLKRRLGE